MQPEERINIIDLTKYAIKKRYLRSSCQMKMNDPLRKLSQRILSKMFPSATISKNRQRRAYNVAFVNKQCCGNYTNYLSGKTLDTYPNRIAKLFAPLGCLLYQVPEVFWAWIVAKHEFGEPRYSNYNYNCTYGEKVNPESVEEIRKNLAQNKYLHYNKSRLIKLLHYLANFDRFYTLQNESLNQIINLEDYGFSFHYSGTLGRSLYNQTNNKIKRYFKEPSTTLYDLEQLKYACKLYKFLITEYNHELNFIYRFGQTFYNNISNKIRRIEESDQYLDKNEAIKYEIGKMFDTNFETQYYKGGFKEKPKDKSEKLETVKEESQRRIIISNAIYNLEDVQSDFNNWLQNREEE